MKTPTPEKSLSPSLTVNEVVRRVPAAVTVFAGHGIDTCCGGNLAVEEAARRHGVDADELLREVAAVTGA